MWRGGRGKAERAKGRAVSETSRESVGKWNPAGNPVWLSGRALRQKCKRLWVRFPGNTHTNEKCIT